MRTYMNPKLIFIASSSEDILTVSNGGKGNEIAIGYNELFPDIEL